MRFQLLSDCHLECYKRIPNVAPLTDLLILAGDIGQLHKQTFKDFIDYASQNWKKTIFVAGNHEYYSSKHVYDKLHQEYVNFFEGYENVDFLEKQETEYEGYRIMGLTMWCPLIGLKKINCTKQIKTYVGSGPDKRKAGIGMAGINEMHASSVEWFMQNYNPDIPTILVTHYPITNDLRAQPPMYWKDGNEGFACNITLPPITKPLVCVSGHTHQSHDFMIGGARFISNQCGYPDEARSGATHFTPNCLFDV